MGQTSGSFELLNISGFNVKCNERHYGATIRVLRRADTKMPVTQWVRCPVHSPDAVLPVSTVEAIGMHLEAVRKAEEARLSVRVIDNF